MRKPVPNPRRRALAELVAAKSPLTCAMYEKAKLHYVGGAVGANKPVFPAPLYISEAQGAHLMDVDGNSYIDCWAGGGTVFFGHNHPAICDRIVEQASKGWMYGLPHELQIKFAEKMKQLLPMHECFVLCNSGTEAVQKAIMLARAATGRNRIVKLSGAYHGTYDDVIMNVRAEPFDQMPIAPTPYIAGVAARSKEETIILPMNNQLALDYLERECLVQASLGQPSANIAAVLIEPVTGTGLIEINADYFSALHTLCKRHGILLVMDEVFAGLRGIPHRSADIHTYGKVIAGGMPIGVVAMSKPIVDACLHLQPPLLMGGTFSGNPLCLSAACAFLDELLLQPDSITQLVYKTHNFVTELNSYIDARGYPMSLKKSGAIFCLYAMPTLPSCPEDLQKNNGKIMDELSLRLRLQGVVMNVTGTGTLTLAHDDSVMESLIIIMKNCIDECYA